MNCVLIASDIGVTAPGIVYESIIKELIKKVDISLFTLEKRRDLELPISVFHIRKVKCEHHRLYKFFMTVFGRNLFDDYWLLSIKKFIDPDIINESQVIISFTSFHNYKSIVLGYYLSKKYNKPWVIYSVDAIPAPIGWCKNDRFYKNTRSFFSYYLSKCNAFFSSNEQMLIYQLSLLKGAHPNSGVLLTPIHSHYILNEYNNRSTIPIFLYTGGLYGPRNKDALISGFKIVLQEYPEAKLIFVGKLNPKSFKSYEDLLQSKHIELYNHTNDLLPFYRQATALIDINAYFDNDVFLSSKIVNYLPLKKPIISITGNNSPSRIIFNDDPSIIHCGHDPQEIYNGLKNILNSTYDYRNRERYMSMFSADKVVDGLYSILRSITLQTLKEY